MKLCGYKLVMSPSMRRTFIESYHEPADAEALYRLVTLGASSKDIAAPFIVLEYGEELSTTLVSFLPRSRVLVEYDHAGKTREAVQTDARTIRGWAMSLPLCSGRGRPLPGARRYCRPRLQPRLRFAGVGGC